MKEKEFNTIYERVLAAVLKVMYLMREDKKYNLDPTQKNYYRKVLKEIKKSEGKINFPSKDEIDELYLSLEKKKTEEE